MGSGEEWNKGREGIERKVREEGRRGSEGRVE
jgi:hypothetical protein